MGFSVGSYAKIWKVEDKDGKYALCQISISSKNKNTKQYETTFSSNVAFFGDAYRFKPKAGQRIKITNCDVTNRVYVKPDGTKTYPFAFSVFSYELQEELPNNGGNSSGNRSAPPSLYEVCDDDGDIPF